MDRKVEISTRSIVFAILFPLGLWFLWIIKELLFSLLIAFIFKNALQPIVNFLERKGFARGFSIFFVFGTFLLVFIGLIALVVPPVVEETTALVTNFPRIVETIDQEVIEFASIADVVQYVPSVTSNVFNILGIFFSNFLFVLTTGFFIIYFMIERDIVQSALEIFLKGKRLEYYVRIVRNTEKRLAAWFWGQLALMVIVGFSTYVVLTLMGVRYASSLAVIAGIFELIPNLGPIISSVPAIMVGLTDSVLTAVIITISYFIIQQIENAFLVPAIVRTTVGINPILTLIALIIGGSIGGLLGVLLAIPVVIIIQTVLAEYVHTEKQTVSMKKKLTNAKDESVEKKSQS